jgi:flagellin-like protein
MNCSTSNKGVSEVVSTILLIAITVLAASILGGFVIQITGILEEPVQGQLDINSEYNPSTGLYDTRITYTNTINAESMLVRATYDGEYSGQINSPRLTQIGETVEVAYPEGTYLVVIAESKDTRKVAYQAHVEDL